MKIRFTIVHLLVALLAAPSAWAQPPQGSADTWRAFAEGLAPGDLVRVELQNGTRVDGRVIETTDEVLRLKPKTRIPVPIRSLAFADIDSIEPRHEGRSPGAKVLIGTATGVGIVMLLFVAALSGMR